MREKRLFVTLFHCELETVLHFFLFCLTTSLLCVIILFVPHSHFSHNYLFLPLPPPPPASSYSVVNTYKYSQKCYSIMSFISLPSRQLRSTSTCFIFTFSSTFHHLLPSCFLVMLTFETTVGRMSISVFCVWETDHLQHWWLFSLVRVRMRGHRWHTLK